MKILERFLNEIEKEMEHDGAGDVDASQKEDSDDKEFRNKQIERGIKVEEEHKKLYNFIKNALEKNDVEMPLEPRDFYKMIAVDHIDEIKDYYTRLDRMETEAKKEKK